MKLTIFVLWIVFFVMCSYRLIFTTTTPESMPPPHYPPDPPIEIVGEIYANEMD